MAPQVPSKEEILREISEHLAGAQGLGELNNVISEIEDLDPQIFIGEDGEMARESLVALLEQKDRMPEHEIRSDLRFILELLGKGHGGRRRRKSRRGRKTRRGGAPAAAAPAGPPQPGTCYEGIEFGPNVGPVYFGMYSNAQPAPMYAERANAGGVDSRGWFTIEGEESVRRHYYTASLRAVPCQNGADSDVEMEAGRRRRRGRKTRRKTLRQRK